MVLKTHFDSLVLKHVYKERNRLVDWLSKEGTQQNHGQWYIKEYNLKGYSGYYHRPFHEGQA